MNSILDWNINLIATFEAKLAFKYQSLSILFLSEQLTPLFQECTDEPRSNVLIYYFDFKSNAMVYELITWFSIS